MAVKNIIILLSICFALPATADLLVRDGEFMLSTAEVEYALAASPPQIRESVMEDEASRYEFFATLLVSKKILAMLEALQVEEGP